MQRLSYIFISKASRASVSSLLSILTPIYLTRLGYSALYVGVALTTILAGNAFFNIILTWYGDYLGRRRSLLVFSLLVVVSGVLLSSTIFLPLILLGLFLGNISTTATEAGPFQSIETGILPILVSKGKENRAFGVYNFIGYGASSIGAFAASAPDYFQDSLLGSRLLYFVYGLVGILLLLVYRKVKNIESQETGPRKIGPGNVRPEARRDITKLSFFYSVDAFGGSLVSQFVLSYWFSQVYKVSLSSLGVIFLAVNVVTAFSTLAAPVLAERLGNLRTMVSTHLLSNVFLIMVPLAGSFLVALAFLFLRQSISQMDVPTRQAFMAQLFTDKERVPANAITNTSRTLSGTLGGPLTAIMFTVGASSLPILTGGFSKILYDLLVFHSYKNKVV
ncbi:MAG TPA: MFS transporter [Candidatus Limnocylindrales bacterium]|nr:MFS transporter [Candidatus Limnocylindrales bacterium]